LDLAEALKDDTIGDLADKKHDKQSPTKTISQVNTTKPQLTKRPTNPNRPAIPPRPSVKKKTSSSLTSTGSSTHSECLLTPLTPISIDLEKDIINSLGPDCQMFFPEWQSRVSKINSEIALSVPIKNAEQSPNLIDCDTTDSRSSKNASENSTEIHEKLSNSLDVASKSTNISSSEPCLIDADTSHSGDVKVNSSPQPSHWVNFDE